MKRKMSEREAWLWLARKWANARGKGDWLVVHVDGHECCGLCPCIEALEYEGTISKEAMYVMIDKIEALPPIQSFGFRWPTTLAGAKQRAAFCRAQAKKLERVKGAK